MKLTPCVVMTCYMLPHHMVIREHIGGAKKFDDGYLYNCADLLIVDEAEQVLPEVAATSFALAKKALVIGDAEQIAPIWNSLPAIDIGNMVEENILPGGTQEELTDAYALMCKSGKSAASGSVMKMAQFSSRYQYDPDLARGMYLYEHRRCFDNIIGYCNALCYHGKLQPKRGTFANARHSALSAGRGKGDRYLFPVYSKHEDGGFIDSDSSMLNVAVSRAKDSFLVFGDMDLFEIQLGSSPRGLLANYLFSSDSNALQFEFKERKDLSATQTQISTLHGVEQ